MIEDNEAGYYCSNCGHSEIVETEESSQKIKSKLVWKDGDPVCPECSEPVTYEDYLD